MKELTAGNVVEQGINHTAGIAGDYYFIRKDNQIIEVYVPNGSKDGREMTIWVTYGSKEREYDPVTGFNNPKRSWESSLEELNQFLPENIRV